MIYLEVTVTPDELARLFHDTYERLAPRHGYETREDSAVPWEAVPEENRALMVATAAEVLAEFQRRGLLTKIDPSNA